MQPLTRSFHIGRKIGFFSVFFLSGWAQAESLRYNIRWPSGLSLGEAALSVTFSPRGWDSALNLEASLPAFTISDHYTSAATAALCTEEFTRQTEHGRKKTDERIRVSPDGKATRETTRGGSTELAIAPCAQDPLALLLAVRRELQHGGIPPLQTVLFGPGYPVRFEMGGAENITIADRQMTVDKVICILTLPKTGDYRIELFFCRDQARTPALIRAPFPIGAFTMELVR